MSAPPEANFGVREIASFLKGVDYGEWRTCRAAQADTRAWRLAQLAATFMAADLASGHLPDGLFWMDRATEIMAEAERRVAAMDGAAT